MDDKQAFFDGLVSLLNQHNVEMIVKIDGKNNNYIGFSFPTATYCCTTPEKISPQNCAFECEEKFIESNGKTEYPEVTNYDNYVYLTKK